MNITFMVHKKIKDNTIINTVLMLLKLMKIYTTKIKLKHVACVFMRVHFSKFYTLFSVINKLGVNRTCKTCSDSSTGMTIVKGCHMSQ